MHLNVDYRRLNINYSTSESSCLDVELLFTRQGCLHESLDVTILDVFKCVTSLMLQRGHGLQKYCNT